MSLFLNDSELQAMAGLPFAAIALYLAIRKRMDLSNGMIGVRYLVSWQAFREDLYIEPEPGRVERGSPHESALRRLALQLEKAGLIKHSSRDRQLIFKCKLAATDKSVQNKPDRHPDRPKHTNEPATARTLAIVPTEPDRHPDTHPSLALYLNKSSSSAAHQDDDDDLIFPQTLNPWNRGRIANLVKTLPAESRQILLDELAGRIQAGIVQRPAGYFQTMIQNYQAGDFSGELAAQQQHTRDRRAKEKQQRETELSRQQTSRANPELARQALSSFRNRQKGSS